MADNTEGGDIRSVIKNATQGGLTQRPEGLGLRKSDGVVGAGNTIASKDEIDTKRAEEGLSRKIENPTVGLGKNIANIGESKVQPLAKISFEQTNMVDEENIRQQVESNGIFTPQEMINGVEMDVNTSDLPGERQIKRPNISSVGLNLRKGVDNSLLELEKEKKKRLNKGGMYLYTSAYNANKNGGELTLEQIMGNEEYRELFKGVDEKKLQNLIDGMNYVAQSSSYDPNLGLYIMGENVDIGFGDMNYEDIMGLPKPYRMAILDNIDETYWAEKIGNKLFSPINFFGEWGIKAKTGKSSEQFLEELGNEIQSSKHDFLSDEELKYTTQNFVKSLDKQYKDYYYNQTEEMFNDARIGKQFYKDVADLKKKEGITEEEAVKRIMKEGTYNGVAYEDFPHETVDQGRFWKDKEKEKEYNEKLKEIESMAREKHGDTTKAWWGNALKDLGVVGTQVLNMATHPVTLVKTLGTMGIGALEKSAEGYINLFNVGDIMSGKDEYKGFKDIVAEGRGYDNWNELMEDYKILAEKGEPGAKFGGWMLENLVGNSTDSINMVGDYLVQAYGGWDNVKQSVYENPMQVLSDVVSLIEGGTMLARGMGWMSPSTYKNTMRVMSFIDPYEAGLQGLNKLQYGWAMKGGKKIPGLMGAEKWAIKTGWKGVKFPYTASKWIIENTLNKMTFTDKEFRKRVKEHPDEVDAYLKGDKTAIQIADGIKEKLDAMLEEKEKVGRQYVKDKQIDTSGIKDKISSVLDKVGVKFGDNGELEFTSNKFTASEKTGIRKAVKTLLGGEIGGEVEMGIKDGFDIAENLWDIRKKLDNMKIWDTNTIAGLGKDAKDLVRDLRGVIDAELKTQVPGWKEADASYSKLLSEIKEFKKGWFDKEGNLVDSAYSKIRNLTRKGNEARLERLEKYMPGITNELRSLAAAEMLDKASKAIPGQYLNQFLSGGGIGAITALLTGGVGATALIMGIMGMALATPRNLATLLRWQGKLEAPFRKISNKLKGGIKLTATETSELLRYMSDNAENLEEEAKRLYEEGKIDDIEFNEALKNKEKEVKKTGNGEKNEYNNKDNLNSNQNKDGRIKESKDDTGKSKEGVGGLAKKEKGVNQGGIGEKTSSKARNDGGRVSQGDGGFIELKTNGEEIVKTLERIKGEQPEGFKMDIHGSDDYGNGKRKTFQSKDGNSSVTVKDDGDITSLVSKKGLGRGKELVLTAIKNGGEKLDCYEDKLPDLYQRGGFEPVARVKWNPEYAPKDWKGKGQDIIVMMRRNNDSVEKVAENWDKYEKIDLDDLPVKEYDEALAYRDMLLAERKKSYKPRKVETVQETPNGLKKKKEWVAPNKPIWEETINKDTGKPYTAEEVDAKMNKIKDKYLNDKNKLRKLYNQYVEINDELDKDLQNTFMKNGYLNPDGLRPLINKEFAKEMGVGDNVMASTNHPAVSKIADAFVEMVGDDMIEKASKGEKINVALIGGGGGSGKSGGPKAMISEGFVKEGDKVDMTLDVQGGANDLKGLIEKARREGVLDKFNFKIAYVYASTEDAGKGVINRTINQNQRILEKQGLNPKVVEKETDIGKNRLYAGRTLPFKIFEQGHLKSVGEKGLRGYIDIAKDIDNVEFMITERIPGDKKNTNKYIVKQGGEWKMTEKELNDLVTRITKNKETGLNWAELEKEGQKAVKEGKISKRQYANLFGRLGAFAFLLMIVGGGNGQEA